MNFPQHFRGNKLSAPKTNLAIAYVLSAFPAISETFILEELIELRRQGFEPLIFSLKKAQPDCVPEALGLMNVVHYSPFVLSIRLWAENIRLCVEHPRLYLSLLRGIIQSLIAQPLEMIKTLAVFPKTVYFASIARTLGCQRVHAHFMNVPAAAARIMASILEVPFSVTAHGSDIYEYPPADFESRIESASPFITISQFNRSYLQKKFPRLQDKIQVVHCGVDLQKLPHRPSRKMGKPIRLLTVARLEKVKGVDILLDSCRDLMERGVDFECWIAGHGSQRWLLESQRDQLGLGSRIHFLGALPRADILNLYSTADIFILPSRREGIPVSVMEAMAVGLPVIAPRVTGLPELVNHDQNGWLVGPNNPSELANAVITLIESPEKAVLFAQHSRSKIETDFNIQTSVRQLLTLWNLSPEPHE